MTDKPAVDPFGRCIYCGVRCESTAGCNCQQQSEEVERLRKDYDVAASIIADLTGQSTDEDRDRLAQAVIDRADQIAELVPQIARLTEEVERLTELHKKV